MKRFTHILWMLFAAVAVLWVIPPEGLAAAPTYVTSGAHSALISHWDWLFGAAASLAPFILPIFGMADVSTNVEYLMRERIEPNIGETYEGEDSLCSWVNDTDAARVSTRAMRIVLEVAVGGHTGGVDLDGGDNFAGGRSQKKLATLNTVAVAHDRAITSLAQYATETNEQAIEKDLTREVGHAIAELKVQEDIYLQGSTDGVLATLTDDLGTGLYNLAKANTFFNPFQAFLLREGAIYDIYNNALTVKRADGPYTVDPDGGLTHGFESTATVTVQFSKGGAADNGIITAYTDGDRAVIPNMKNAAFQGLAYHISNAIAGTWQGIPKAKEYARSVGVDATGATLGTAHLYELRSKIFLRTGKNGMSGLTPYLPVAQEQNYLQLAEPNLAIAQMPNDGKVDMMYGSLNIAGSKVMTNIHAHPEKVYFLKRANFVRAETRKLGFKTDRNGNKIFCKIGSNGAPKNEDWFQVEHMWQLGARKVNDMGIIYNLEVPSKLTGTYADTIGTTT